MQNPERVAPPVDVLVIGGGIAGLTAAAFASGTGATVRLLDARTDLGGRARTAVVDGFHFNEGPHALYRAGAGMAALRELGITPKGGNPPLARSRIMLEGTARRTLPPRAVRQLAHLLRRLGADRLDPGLVGIGADEWLDHRVSDPTARSVAAALVRVSSYSGDLATFSADAAAGQLHAALRGVIYLHGGWSQLVVALDAAARVNGVAVDTAVKVSSVHDDGDHWVASTAAGSTVSARSVVIAAAGAGAADRLLGGASESVTTAAVSARPVHAACLDLGLDRLTTPGTRFILGADRPTYASIHTPKARLADHGHLVHLMHYEPGDDVGVAQLETLADELQPGWRDHELARQVGQRRVVAFDRPQPGRGMAGRHGAAVDDLPGIFVAGDWVGPDDLLGGAAIASGRRAGLAAATRRRPAGRVTARA